MGSVARNHVTFQATGFNTTEDLEEFINPCNFGKDVAEWLITELEGKVPNIDPEVGQEDFGWYFTFTGNTGKEYNFFVGQYGDEGWLAFFKRSLGLFEFLFWFWKKREISRDDLMVFNQIFKQSERVSDVKWHYRDDFMKGNEDVYSDAP
ncbi:MAG: hypothetical protein FVQ82_00265 [Planctomycetes bacterium]|nr:hypothetical protein [Planctomycetota bacterium]